MNHRSELDGLRGLAVLLVIAAHYLHTPMWMGGTSSYLGPLYHVVGIGWVGVDLFFVLSGFLIGGILFDNRGAENVYRVFYVRRVCRIMPLYLLLLGSFYAVKAIELPAASALMKYELPLWSYLTMTMNFLQCKQEFYGASWMSPTWSLAIEEQFYLVLPFLVVNLSRQAVVRLALAIVVLSGVGRAFLSFEVGYTLTFTRLDGLFLGVLLAHTVRDEELRRLAVKHLPQLKLLCWLMGVGMLALCFRRMRFGAMSHTWVAVFFGLLLLICFLDGRSRITRLMQSKQLGRIGVLAYSLYLIHQPINGLIHGAVHGGAPEIDSMATLALTGVSFGVSLLTAELLYRLLERPMIQLGKRMAYVDARGSSPVPSAHVDSNCCADTSSPSGRSSPILATR